MIKTLHLLKHLNLVLSRLASLGAIAPGERLFTVLATADQRE